MWSRSDASVDFGAVNDSTHGKRGSPRSGASRRVRGPIGVQVSRTPPIVLVAILVLAALSSTAGCTSAPRYRAKGDQPPKRTAYRKSERGKVYQIGMASYYADDYHGKRTANGEIYDMHAMTAAHNELDFGTLIRVTNLGNGKSVTVRINDRGPLVEGRILDLSYAAARKLDMIGSGSAKVRIEILPRKE